MPRARLSSRNEPLEAKPLSERHRAPGGHSIMQMARMGGMNHSLSNSVRERVEMDCLAHMLNF